MLQDRGRAAKPSSPKKIFNGVRFVLFGFDSVSEAQYRSELVDGGGVDVGRYESSCTHVVVSGRVFDEPVCVAARNDGKVLVTELWIDDSLGFGMLADATKVLYRPVRDLSGIPGSKALHICLTGYQRQERDDIMRMVSLMGGRFSKPLIANQITHLICYKFEGEKYELARKVNIKLVNHRWLEDCLKAWEILPIDNYKKSGWELEVLEAEAMDSEEEAEDFGKKVTKQRTIAESHSLQGEMPITIVSGSLADTRNLPLKKNVSTAKPFDFSADNQLISTPHKECFSGKAIDFCDTKSKVLEINCSAAELPSNHGMGITNSKQAKTTDPVDVSLNCNLPSNIRSSLVGLASCEEGLKLGSLGYPKTAKKIVSPKNQFTNLCTPREGKSEEINKGDANFSSAEFKDGAAKKCIYDNLHGSMVDLNKQFLEVQTHVFPKKRKLSASKVNSKSMKSDQDPRNSGLMDAPKIINHAELDFLKPQQLEHENVLMHTETSPSNCHLVEDNGAFCQMDGLSVSCLRSPELAHHDSGTCIKQSLSADGFVGTSFVQQRANQHGSLPNSSSLTFKRKILKHLHSASVANTSNNSSSMLDNKDELFNVASKPGLDGTVCSTDEPVSELGTVHAFTSPEALALSACLLNNEIMQAKDKSIGNDPNFFQSDMAGDGGNANEASICVREPEASLKSVRKSGSHVKSQNLDGVSMKNKTDIQKEAPEQLEGVGEVQKVFFSASKDANVKGSVSTEISGCCKKGRAIDVSIRRTNKVLVNHNMGCRPKTSRENCKNRSSDGSMRSTNSNNRAVKLGNGIDELSYVDNYKEKVEKADLPLKENGKMEQNPNVVSLEANHRDPERDNKLKDNCKLFAKGDCGHKVKKIIRSSNCAKRPSGGNINSLPKLSCSSVLITEPMWFILSGHHGQRNEFKKIIKRLRGRICKDSHSWAYEATHFIIPDYVRRTQKFFAAAAAGRWILKPDYLTASGEAGKFLNEEPFEWHKKGLTEDGAISLEAPQKWRTLREKTGHGAFYGMRIIIYGECIAPPLDTLKRAVKAGDGTILATSPPYTRFLKSSVDFAIVNASMPIIDGWVQEFLRHEIPCVLPDYLVEYVCKPGYSLERHVLYKTHKWAEKSFVNLLNRSEEVVSDVMSIEDGLNDMKCVVCGAPDREEVMLICGDEALTRGCGVGTHMDCCDPPLEKVPEDDWFCSSCSRNIVQNAQVKKPNKIKRKKNK